MNIYEVEYNISSKDDSKYIVLSDFHGYFDKRLAYLVSNEEIDYVVIAGDLLDGYQWVKKKKLDEVRSFIGIIAEKHPVIVALGNHDLFNLSKEGLNNYKSLKNIDNVYPLYKDSVIIGNNRFTNFLPNHKSFSYPMQDSRKTINELLRTIKNMEHVDKNSKYIEHLVAHNPYHFNHEVIRKEISSNYDVIETGHFHDGWVPTKILDKRYNKYMDKGIHELLFKIFSFKKDNSLVVKPKRNLSRGVVYIFKDGYIVLLPDDSVYYYNYDSNRYFIKDKEYLNNRLNEGNVPSLIINGAVNTFMRLKMFYPYITKVNLTKEKNIHESNRQIKRNTK